MGILTGLNVEKNLSYQVTEALKGSTDVGEVIYQPGSRVPEVDFCAHDGSELCYVSKGEVVFGTEEGEVVVKEGEFHYLKKGELHFCRNDYENESRLLYILVK